jgi:hypothetical protein
LNNSTGKSNTAKLSHVPLTYKEAKTNIKGTYLNKWKEEHQQYDANGSFYRLSRMEQAIIF